MKQHDINLLMQDSPVNNKVLHTRIEAMKDMIALLDANVEMLQCLDYNDVSFSRISKAIGFSDAALRTVKDLITNSLGD